MLVSRVRDDAGPRRHALLREAAPAAVEGSKVICRIPAHLPFHLEQLQQDDDLMRRVLLIAGELLGGSITLVFTAGEADGPADGDATDDATAADDATTESELLEPGSAAVDPTGLVVDLLGGEVVSE